MAPWAADRVSIFDFVNSNIDPQNDRLMDSSMNLPDEEQLNSENELRFVSGGLEGAFGHHGSPEDTENDAGTAFSGLKAVLRKPSPENLSLFYDTIKSESVLEYIDPLLDKIVSDGSINLDHLNKLINWLIRNSPDRGPVKIGLAIAGLFADKSFHDVISALGKHDEFTLYATVAMLNSSDQPEADIWEIAKAVTGWGRIHAVEGLENTDNPDIKAWLVREGYRNDIMYEYLAHICATTGNLLSELRKPSPDDKLLAGAGDILNTLIIGGPALDMNDYADGAAASLLYLQHIQKKQPDLKVYLIVSNLRRIFLTAYISRRPLITI